MYEADPLCPECGDPLIVKFLKDEEEITLEFFCEGDYDDRFRFQILTRMTDEDLIGLHEIGKTIQKKMVIRLLERKSNRSTR